MSKISNKLSGGFLAELFLLYSQRDDYTLEQFLAAQKVLFDHYFEPPIAAKFLQEAIQGYNDSKRGFDKYEKLE